jgi:ATP-dependent DNA helicase DinG
VRPEHLERADALSLKINNYSVSEWNTALPVKEALTQFVEKTAGAIMVAHNVAFDAEFLNHHLSLNGLASKMHYHRLDTVSMAFAKLHTTPDASRYSLMELCKYFGITNDRPHSALADALADFELFKKLLSV